MAVRRGAREPEGLAQEEALYAGAAMGTVPPRGMLLRVQPFSYEADRFLAYIDQLDTKGHDWEWQVRGQVWQGIHMRGNGWLPALQGSSRAGEQGT